jgi:YXWGXW repeat-containing protein
MPAVVVGTSANVTMATVTPGVSTTIVTEAPPALQPEVVLAQPASNYVWIAGYWSWRNEQYEWMAGHWELPPNSRSAWVTPRWEQQGNAYKFYEGYWD